MGHSSVKITEIYLEDFKSRQARLQHTRYSPLGRLKLHKTSKQRRKYRHYQQQADDDNE
jgi:integrase/recombinase XerD